MMNELGIGTRVKHARYGVGIVCGGDLTTYRIFFREHGDKEFAKESSDDLQVLENVPPAEGALTLEAVEEALASVLQKFADFTPLIPLGEKWIGGMMTLQP